MKAKQKRSRPGQIMVDRSAAFLADHDDEHLTVADVSAGIRWEASVEAHAFAKAKVRVLSDILRRARIVDEHTGRNTGIPKFGRYYIWIQTNKKEKKIWCIREWHLMDRLAMTRALEQRDKQWKLSKSQLEKAAEHCNTLLRRWKQKPLKYADYEFTGGDEDGVVA